MRSEAPPLWTGFLIGMGVTLLVAAFMAMATGKFKVTRNNIVIREENPEAFWTWVGGMFVVAIGSLIIAIPHFRPGG